MTVVKGNPKVPFSKATLTHLLSGATSQSEHGRNDSEGELQITQIFKPGASLSDGLMSYLGDSSGGVLPLCKGIVGAFYSPSWLDSEKLWKEFQHSFEEYQNLSNFKVISEQKWNKIVNLSKKLFQMSDSY